MRKYKLIINNFHYCEKFTYIFHKKYKVMNLNEFLFTAFRPSQIEAAHMAVHENEPRYVQYCEITLDGAEIAENNSVAISRNFSQTEGRAKYVRTKSGNRFLVD